MITIFGVEKAVFQREYSSGMYGLPAYFISRNAVEVGTTDFSRNPLASIWLIRLRLSWRAAAVPRLLPVPDQYHHLLDGTHSPSIRSHFSSMRFRSVVTLLTLVCFVLRLPGRLPGHF